MEVLTEFEPTEITDIVIESNHAIVSTYEVVENSSPYDNWTDEEYVDYLVVIDEDGMYRISE
jgi:hypothetical protein